MNTYFNKDQNNLKELFHKWGQPIDVLKERYGKTSAANFYTWASGKRCPPLNLLIDMTWETNTNLSYALGFTEVKHKNERADINLRLKELLDEANLSNFTFGAKIDTTSVTIEKYINENVKMRIETLLAMADGLNVSIDYLLGLTDYKTWEEYMMTVEPFSILKPGDAAYISFENSDLDGYVLMNSDGSRIIFPSGKTRPIHDEIFEGVKIRKVIYEKI